MSLCRLLWAENGVLSLDEDKVGGLLHRCLSPNGGGVIGAIGQPGKIEGMIAMIISQFWYSSDWILEELFSYIHPDYRRSPNARHLVAFAKAYASALDIPLFIGVISTPEQRRKYVSIVGSSGNPLEHSLFTTCRGKRRRAVSSEFLVGKRMAQSKRRKAR